MEKNRIRSVKTGKSMRMSYQRQKEVLEMPNLIEVQKDSYQWFLDEGLKEVFDDISPIADYGGKLSLEFIDFTYDEKDAKYSIEQCKERDVTYAAPLKVRVRLINKETEEINEHEIFMGDLPLMTATGTFVINGAERVIVSQLVRSPGIYYAIAHDKLGKRLFSSTVIPNRGAWLEYETDSNDVFYVRVDRTRKVPITVLIRALGIGHYHVVLGYRRQIGGGYKFLLKHIRILPFLGGNKNTFGVRNDGRGRRKHLIRIDRKSTRLNSSHNVISRMPSSA